MTVQAPVRGAPRAAAPNAAPAPVRWRPRRAPGGAAPAAAVAASAVLLAVWPTLTLLALAVTLIALLARLRPALAVVATVALFGCEGLIKVGLGRELGGLAVDPNAVAAALIDLSLAIALVGIVASDGGRSLRAIWRGAGRLGQAGMLLLGAWLALSLLQMAPTGDPGAALAGLRLTQAYALAAVAGALLLARRPPDGVLAALVAVLGVIAAYAAFRAIAGPAEAERVAAFSRSTTPLVPTDGGAIFRNTGSFSSAIGLVSFLVPAGVFAFGLGLLVARLRPAAWTATALVLVALVGTHVRTGLLAIAVGLIAVQALVALTGGLRRRSRLALAAGMVPLLMLPLALGSVAQVTVSGGAPQVRERSVGVLKPLADASLAERLDRWRAALDVVRANPLGTGVGTVGAATASRDGEASFADNSYVKVLQEQGPLGALAFMGGLIACLLAIAARLGGRPRGERAVGIAATAGVLSFFVLGLSSEAIEQPGKLLAWLLLGVAMWAAFGHPSEPEAAPQRRRAQRRRRAAALGRRLRSPSALAGAAALVGVPLAIGAARAPHYATTLELLPVSPPGNAGVSSAAGPSVPGVVANPGFQTGAGGWRPAAGAAVGHSRDQAHSGSGSLAAVAGPRAAAGAGALTSVRLPAPGRYRVQAWVRLPRGHRGGRPSVELRGIGGRRVAAAPGDLSARGRWQLVWSDHVVAGDLRGEIVLGAPPTPRGRGPAIHWDDVSVLSWRGAAAARSSVNLVANPGFEYDTGGWGAPPRLRAARTRSVAHSGGAALRTSAPTDPAADTNAGYAHVVVPRAGTYRAHGWAYLPDGAPAVRAGVFLEGYAHATAVGQRLADPGLRDAWQPVWTEYVISDRDREGSLVLRNLPDPAAGGEPARGPATVVWDDLTVPGPPPPAPDRARAAAMAADVRAALHEPQLRFELSQMTGHRGLYEPRRATVARRARGAGTGFAVTVASDVPADARALAGPLREALERASRRSARRRAQARWDRFVTAVGARLAARPRALLQRRAAALEAVIGAQPAGAVALPAPSAATRPANAAAARARRRLEQRRGRIVARLGDGLPPPWRALVEQRAEDLQRALGADARDHVVLPAGSVKGPTRAIDRLLDGLPAPFPPRVGPISAVAAGALAALLWISILGAAASARARRRAGLA